MIEAILKFASDKDYERYLIVTFAIKVILTLYLSVKLYGAWIGTLWLQQLPSLIDLYQWFVSGNIIIGIGMYFLVWFTFYGGIQFLFVIYVMWLIKQWDKTVEEIYTAIKNLSLEEVIVFSNSKLYKTIKAWGFVFVKDGKIQPGWAILDMAHDFKRDYLQEKERKSPGLLNPSILIQFVVAVVFIPGLKMLPILFLGFGLIAILLLLFVSIFLLTCSILIDKYKAELLAIADLFPIHESVQLK